MDMELKEQLETRLYEKMARENEEYLAEIKTKPAEEIIDSAYQIAWRENVLLSFEDSTELNPRQLQTLLELPSPLAELYDEWLSEDSNELGALRDSISKYATHQINQRMERLYSDPKTPMYKKNLAEAIMCGEQYDWRASDERNRMCNQEFAVKASSAHLCQTFQHFLEKWVEQYGLERCMFVLSCTMELRKEDSPFASPTKRGLDRFVKLRERAGERITYYANDVHLGIVNLAMEKLLKMERRMNGKEVAHMHDKRDLER